MNFVIQNEWMCDVLVVFVKRCECFKCAYIITYNMMLKTVCKMIWMERGLIIRWRLIDKYGISRHWLRRGQGTLLLYSTSQVILKVLCKIQFIAINRVHIGTPNARISNLIVKPGNRLPLWSSSLSWLTRPSNNN